MSIRIIVAREGYERWGHFGGHKHGVVHWIIVFLSFLFHNHLQGNFFTQVECNSNLSSLHIYCRITVN